MYAICHLSVVPVRKEPSDRSEMVTQLLLGDLVEVGTSEGNWRQVSIFSDGYTGWVDMKQLLPLSDEEALMANASSAFYCDSLTAVIRDESNSVQTIVLGSHLPLFSDGTFRLGVQRFSFRDAAVMPNVPTSEGIVGQAMKYLHAPYLWGGKSPFGIDCSGLTQMAYRLNGITLPRDAWQQAAIGEEVVFSEGLRAGDLAFFENAEKKVVHVGIVLDGNRIIHASGQVRIDTLDEKGIVRTGDQVRTHSLCCVKRFF